MLFVLANGDRGVAHIGHSTDGGDVARQVVQHGLPAGRVASAVLVSSQNPEQIALIRR